MMGGRICVCDAVNPHRPIYTYTPDQPRRPHPGSTGLARGHKPRSGLWARRQRPPQHPAQHATDPRLGPSCGQQEQDEEQQRRRGCCCRRGGEREACVWSAAAHWRRRRRRRPSHYSCCYVWGVGDIEAEVNLVGIVFVSCRCLSNQGPLPRASNGRRTQEATYAMEQGFQRDDGSRPPNQRLVRR